MRTAAILPFVLMVALSGCNYMPVTNAPYQDAVKYYQTNRHQVYVGMTIEEYEKFIAPAEAHYKHYAAGPYRQPDRFTRNGHIVDVYYPITRYVGDLANTDDEYTPHIFVDGKLAAIGWEPLGGTQRTSQDVAREKAKIKAEKAGRTVVNQSSSDQVPMMEIPKIETNTQNVRIVP